MRTLDEIAGRGELPLFIPKAHNAGKGAVIFFCLPAIRWTACPIIGPIRPIRLSLDPSDPTDGLIPQAGGVRVLPPFLPRFLH
jgi:hypothetical protein